MRLPFFPTIVHIRREMPSTLSVALHTAWAALHTLQYGFGISAFNGIQDAVTCPKHSTGKEGDRWLRSCIPLTVSHSQPLVDDVQLMTCQPTQFGLIVAVFTLGGLIGALSTDIWSKRCGRVGTLRLSAASVLVGSAVTGLANRYLVLLLGR